MLNVIKSLRWSRTYLAVLSIGLLSVILLLWVDWLNEKQNKEESYTDALMDVQISTATAHLWLDLAAQGKSSIDANEAVENINQAIILINAILNGGMTEHHFISEPLQNPIQRSQMEEINSLLIKFKALIVSRLENPRSAAALDTSHDDIFKEFTLKARTLERSMEREQSKHEVIARRLFMATIAAWIFAIIIASLSLLRIERLRKGSEDALVLANAQLSAQAKELVEHREHLEDLVQKRTSELISTNERLRTEITEHGHTEEELKESQHQLRNLSSRLLAAQEDERKRISRELHDELGQSLTLVKFRIRSIEKRLDKDQEVLREECENTLKYLNEVIENVRRLSSDLSPYIIEDLGLTRALIWLCEDLKRTSGINFISDIIEIDDFFRPDAKTNIYRIVQESLNNIVNHSTATRASVSVRKQSKEITFLIEDNGKGFDFDKGPAIHAEKRGLGLASMAERARMLGGSINVMSDLGKGTHISFSLPIDTEEEINERMAHHTG